MAEVTPLRLPITSSVLSLVLTALISIGGTIVTVYATQATQNARLTEVERRANRDESTHITRDELQAQLEAVKSQLAAIREDLKEMRQELRK